MSEGAAPPSRTSVETEIGAFVETPVTLRHLGGYLGRNDLYSVAPIKSRAVRLNGRSSAILKIFCGVEAYAKWDAEKSSYGLLHTMGPVIPELLGSGIFADTPDGPGAPWILVEHKPGLLWETHRDEISKADEGHLYEEAGALLAGLHAIRPASNGFRLPKRDCQQYYRDCIERLFRLDLPERILFEEARQSLLGLEDPANTHSRAFCFVHRDYSARNLIVDTTPEQARIAGLIDFERAAIGDPMEDFATFVFKELLEMSHRAPRFFRGYGSRAPLPPSFGTRLRYHLIGLLLEIAGWAHDTDHDFYDRAVAALQLVVAGDARTRFFDDKFA